MSSTSSSVSSTSFSSTSSSSSTSTTTLPPPFLTYSYQDEASFTTVQYYGTSSPTIWVCPANVTSVIAECHGAGGGGGGGTTGTSNAAGGGGGAGGYSKKTVTVTPGTSYTVTVGVGGSGGTGGTTGSNTSGGAGGDSWFSSSGTVLAKGGGGGIQANGTSSVAGGTGGQAASGIGDVTRSGGDGGATGTGLNDGGGGGGGGAGDLNTGQNGGSSQGLGGGATGGKGGATYGGTGGAGGSASGGAKGKLVGAGSGGGNDSSTTNPNGSDGLVILTYTTIAPPTVGTSVINTFNAVQYGDESVDDGDYFITYGSEYMIQVYRSTNTNNTDTPKFTWTGRSTESTLVSPILIQIFNVNSGAWETLATINTLPADVDSPYITVTQTSNVSNYYDSSNTVTFRSYQRVI